MVSASQRSAAGTASRIKGTSPFAVMAAAATASSQAFARTAAGIWSGSIVDLAEFRIVPGQLALFTTADSLPAIQGREVEVTRQLHAPLDPRHDVHASRGPLSASGVTNAAASSLNPAGKPSTTRT